MRFPASQNALCHVGYLTRKALCPTSTQNNVSSFHKCVAQALTYPSLNALKFRGPRIFAAAQNALCQVLFPVPGKPTKRVFPASQNPLRQVPYPSPKALKLKGPTHKAICVFPSSQNGSCPNLISWVTKTLEFLISIPRPSALKLRGCTNPNAFSSFPKRSSKALCSHNQPGPPPVSEYVRAFWTGLADDSRKIGGSESVVNFDGAHARLPSNSASSNRRPHPLMRTFFCRNSKICFQRFIHNLQNHCKILHVFLTVRRKPLLSGLTKNIPQYAFFWLLGVSESKSNAISFTGPMLL